MIGGMDRYFQIARCFRDEDLRADRQPEFTQIDIEMSFGEEEDIYAEVEKVMKGIFKEVKNIDDLEFPRLKYVDAMNYYGSDKPDIRFGNKLEDVTSLFTNTEFKVFKDVIDNGGIIKAVRFNGINVSRKNVDAYTEFVKIYKAKGLAYLKKEQGQYSGSLNNALTDTEKESLNLNDGEIIFMVCGDKTISNVSLGALRVKIANDYNLIDKNKYAFVWITEFPMYEYSEEEDRYVAAHHPFTSPRLEDMDKLINDKENCYSRAYDLVLNGYELLSGSVRIHNKALQAKVFEALEITPEKAKERFGFFLEAFEYGAPPHLGVGIGLERLMMILTGTDNIKDVVAFPKTASAMCLMSDAPGNVDKDQLDFLGLEIKKD